MRLSALPNDSGYEKYQTILANGGVVNVFLNGQKVEEVETADEEEGFIIRAAKDDVGGLLLNDAGDEILRERLEGKVIIMVGQKQGCDCTKKEIVDA